MGESMIEKGRRLAIVGSIWAYLFTAHGEAGEERYEVVRITMTTALVKSYPSTAAKCCPRWVHLDRFASTIAVRCPEVEAERTRVAVREAIEKLGGPAPRVESPSDAAILTYMRMRFDAIEAKIDAIKRQAKTGELPKAVGF